MRRLGNRAQEANALGHAAGLEVRMGGLDAAVELAERSLRISRELGNAWGIATACFHLGDAFIQRGRYREARAMVGEGLEAARRSGFVPLVACHQYLHGCLHRASLALAAAEAALREARHTARQLPFRVFEEIAWSGLCAVRLLAADAEGAAACGRAALRLRGQASPFFARGRWADADELARTGRLDEAERDLASLDRQIGRYRRTQVTLARGRAAIEAARGNREAAAAHLAVASKLAGELGLPGERWEICLALAELDPARAASALDEARAIVASLDLDADVVARFEALPRVRALRSL